MAEYRVARAAFDEAVKLRPGRIVTLRQKTRWLADSRKLSPSSIAFLCTSSWVRAWPSAPRTKALGRGAVHERAPSFLLERRDD